MVGGHCVAFWEVLGGAVLWEVLSCVGLLLVLGYVVCMVGKGAHGGYFEVKAIFKSFFFCKVSSKILGKLFFFFSWCMCQVNHLADKLSR